MKGKVALALVEAAVLSSFCCCGSRSEAGLCFVAAARSSWGCLTRRDLKRALQVEQSKPLAMEEVDAIFEALDLQRDGGIPFSVFTAATMGRLVEIDLSLLQKAFAKMDVGGDGFLSADDLLWSFKDPFLGCSHRAAPSVEQHEDGRLGFHEFELLVRGSEMSGVSPPAEMSTSPQATGGLGPSPAPVRSRPSAAPEEGGSDAQQQQQQQQLAAGLSTPAAER